MGLFSLNQIAHRRPIQGHFAPPPRAFGKMLAIAYGDSIPIHNCRMDLRHLGWPAIRLSARRLHRKRSRLTIPMGVRQPSCRGRKRKPYEAESRLMMTFDYDYLDDQNEREDSDATRRPALKFKPRKRPEYCKKRPPVRQGVALRNNYRTMRS